MSGLGIAASNVAAAVQGSQMNPGPASFYIADVLMYIPGKNLYVLLPKLQSPGIPRVTSASGPVTSGGVDTGCCSIYPTGSRVVVQTEAARANNADNIDSIVAAVPDATDADDFETPIICRDGAFSSALDELKNGLVDSIQLANLAPRKTSGLPGDILPGDTCVNSPLGNKLLIGKLLVRLGVSDQVCTMYDALLKKNSSRGNLIETVTPVSLGLTGADMDRRLAWEVNGNTREELFYDKAAKKLSYRRFRLNSMLAGGDHKHTVMPNDGGGVPVFAENNRDDGSSVRMSASGLSMVKTPDIPVIYPKELAGQLTSAPERPLIKGMGFGEGVTAEKVLRDAPLNFEASIAANARGKTYPGSLASPDAFGTSFEESAPVKVTDNTGSRRSIPAAGNEQQYPLPDIMKLTDPATGEEYTYYKSTANIEILPDGSLSLFDGYGSEIRLSRGNIIISSALDTFFRPGRDLVGLSGRHIAMLAQDTTTIHSSTSDVFIKAEKGVSVLAGNGGDGALLLESRSESSGGVVIRSKTNLSVSGLNVHLGVSGGTTGAATGVDRSASGTLVIDAGGGSLSVSGKDIIESAERISLVAVDRGGGSVVQLTPSSVLSSGRTVAMSAGRVVVAPMVKEADATLPGPVGLDTYGNIGFTGDRTEVTVAGGIELSGGMRVGESVHADTVYGRSAAFSNASDKSGLKGSVTAPRISPPAGPTASLASAKTHFEAANLNQWNDGYIVGTEFAYPSSQELGIEPEAYELPGMRWQEMIEGADTWNDSGVTGQSSRTVTMPYPGEAAWKKGKVSRSRFAEAVSLLTGYVVNRKRSKQ